MVTALSPVIGYDKASEIAHLANANDRTPKEVVLRLSCVDATDFVQIVDPKKMTGWGPIGAY